MVAGLRGIAFKFALFAVISAVLAVLLVNTMRNGLVGDTREFDAQFSDVSGLRVGDDVKVAGVRVGRVEQIEVHGDGARVTLQVRDSQPILDTTRLVMRYQDLLGQRYVAVVQTGAEGKELDPGASIPLSRTDPGFDLTALLNGFRPLFEILQPADVNTLATSIVQVLQGQGGTVETLLQQTGQLTNFLASRDDVIGSVLDNLTPVLTNLAAQDTRFDSTVKELRLLMTGLAKDRRSIGASIDGVSQLVGTTSDFLNDARDPSVAAIRRLRGVASVMAGSRTQLTGALRSFGTTFESLGRTGSYENALNIYGCSLVFSLLGLQIGTGDGPYSTVCR